ncbi:hypothetical protein PG993_004506 [Apiospora rasikravindrae]|uniref:Uncharacterized protein n=1 Tax=Apiospora rasikravindrae TaxID=990691 RepID=A0ABR1TDI8_9PEZI
MDERPVPTPVLGSDVSGPRMADMTVNPTTTTNDDAPCQSTAAAGTPTQPPELAAANAPLIPRQPDGAAAGGGTSSSSSSCLLLTKLPQELRNAIYALLLPRTPPAYPSSFRRYRMPASARPRFWTPAVAQTCRQIRHEVLRVYLGGANNHHLVRVGLWIQEPWDALYLERWLQDLGDEARLVRRFAINHQVDFYHASARSLACTQTVWADTVFTVVQDDQGEDVVRVECDFGLPANPVSDQIPAGTVCRCPLAARLPPPSALSVPPRTADCALTRAVYAFLALMDQEGQDVFAVPRFQRGRIGGLRGARGSVRAAGAGGGISRGPRRRRTGGGSGWVLMDKRDLSPPSSNAFLS